MTAIRMPGEQILAMERSADMAFDPAERADAHETSVDSTGDCPFRRYQVVRPGRDVAIIGLSNTMPLAAEVAGTLDTCDGIDATLINALQYSTIDGELLDVLADGHRVVVTLEDGQLEGGWGEKVTAFYANSTNPKAATVHALNFGASKEFTDRVPLAELDERYGLTVEAVADRIRRVLAR